MQAEMAGRESGQGGTRRSALYTPAERVRRDATVWTLVQGILAPVQFLIFAISLFLVVRYLATGQGLALATGSVVVKTLALYTIMVTGAIWEKVVFGKYLFAESFFWEDVFSMLVIGKSITEIAEILHLSVKTVSTHKTRILQKMSLNSLAELVQYAVAYRLLAPMKT